MSTFVPFFLKSLREACMFDANSSGIFLHRDIPKKETRVCNNTVLPEVCLQKEHPKPFYTTSLKALLSETKTLLQVCISVWSANCTLVKQVYKANLFVRQKADCSSACVSCAETSQTTEININQRICRLLCEIMLLDILWALDTFRFIK